MQNTLLVCMPTPQDAEQPVHAVTSHLPRETELQTAIEATELIKGLKDTFVSPCKSMIKHTRIHSGTANKEMRGFRYVGISCGGDERIHF